MRFVKTMVVFGVISTVSCIGFADTTNTIKQENTKNKITNQVTGKASVKIGPLSGGGGSVGGSAVQNSIMVNDTKKTSHNTIDLKGGDNTITGQGTQNSITVGK
ncbi:hypothetical protein [Collimonas sp. OK242]|uniref:hypothetical protein n=1 Tax=Collimonas sp. OK242 TaxID=1798195 RepID=UPI00115FE156|nr:hypothetical protein [Collimonas sp. OK242]